MKEIPISGQFYRVLVDEANKIWHRISFWTKASDVQFDDGSFLSEKSFGHCMVERSKKYNNGDIVYCENAPSWAMFMCHTPGITAKTEPLEYKTVQLPGTMVTDGTAEFLVMDVRPATTVSSNQCQAPSMNNLKVVADNVTNMSDSAQEGRERLSNVNVYVDKDGKLHFADAFGNDKILNYKMHDATYTFAADDVGSVKDLGETHKYRYINAKNVYTKGVQDGLDASTTNVKKIEYTYHHHTQTSTSADNDNQAACPFADNYMSTTKGGCFQTPYYRYNYTVNHPAVYTTHDFVTITNDSGGVVDRCTRCGMVIGHGTGGSWGGNTCKVRDAYTGTSSGWTTSRPSNVQETRYIRSCGCTNGQLIRQKINFN